MSRGQKIQEVFIQILVFLYALTSFGDLSFRPFLNQLLGLGAVAICLAAIVMHLGNWWRHEKFYQPNILPRFTHMWKFLVGMLAFMFLTFLLSKMSILAPIIQYLYLLIPLIFLYPIRYFWQQRWFQRSTLLAGILLMIYSQIPLSKNDQLHQILNLAVRKNKFGPHLVNQFDKKSLTPAQANDVAWVLTVHPDESLRDYDKAVEFASLGMKKEKREEHTKNLADTLACAYLGQKNKIKAKAIIEKYELSSRESLLEADELCESATVTTRSPASVRKKRKYKYYF